MKVQVNTEVCVGFGICIGIAPKVFELSEDGYAVVLVGDVAPQDEDSVRRAASQCPAQAISVTESPVAGG